MADFPKLYTIVPADTIDVNLLSGWHDMPVPRTDVPGTLGDAELQRDVQLTIWKQDSIRKWSCERETLSAEVINADESRIVSSLPADVRERAMPEQFSDELITEMWLVKSCGRVLGYEVLMSTSADGGKDMMVLNTTDPAGPGADVSETGADNPATEPDVLPAVPQTEVDDSSAVDQPVGEAS